VRFSRSTLGRLYRRPRDGDVLGHGVTAQARQCQDENQPQAHTRDTKSKDELFSQPDFTALNRILEIGNWRYPVV
jgi:hypothetical protein